MKNNEILLTVRFFDGNERIQLRRDLTFLVLKDITLRELIEGVYYGLQKRSSSGGEDPAAVASCSIPDARCSELFETYLKTHRQIVIQYLSKWDAPRRSGLIDFAETVDGIPVYDRTLDSLGIVTTSCLLITNERKIRLESLFRAETTDSYIIRGDDLEYNISSRRLNVVEPCVIDIQPAGARPKIDSAAIGGALLTSGLSIGLGIGMRTVMSMLSSNNSYGTSMIWMSVGMGLVSAITMMVNSVRQSRKQKKDAVEWQKNYERYILKTIRKIVMYQKQDINYLNTVYPQMDKLFHLTETIDSSIFCRSQNDDDFLTVSLGISEQIDPMFEIKAEKKEEIIEDEIRYKLALNPAYTGDSEDSPFTFEMILPPDKKRKRKQWEENTNPGVYPLISELAYNFANNEPAEITGSDMTEVRQTVASKVGFRYLKSYSDSKNTASKPPLLFELRNCGALGVISSDYEIAQRFIRHVVFELSFYHSPENLQFVFFFKPDTDLDVQNAISENYKYLPHTNELLEGMSQFVFDKQSAGKVFSRLLSVMSERGADPSEDDDDSAAAQTQYTQIVCIFFDDYDIKETGFSRYLPEPPKQGEDYQNTLGLTFIFLQDEKGKLPKYCGSTINLDQTSGILRKRYNVLTREVLTASGENKTPDTLVDKKEFRSPYLFSDEVSDGHQLIPIRTDFNKAYRQLSAIYYKRIAENGKVPSVVSLFEIWDIHENDVADVLPGKDSPVVQKIRDYWDHSDITRGLDVPIGMNEHGVTFLDMHQDGDGPHGLVAGTTGSGKSETLITYVIGCCMKYKPEDLNFMLVDMKGGGFSDRLGRLPHLVGAVTNTTGEEEGIAAEYMLKRFLEALNAEIKRRELVLKKLDTDNIDSYIRTRKTVLQKRQQILDGEKTFEEIKKEFMNKDNRARACDPANAEPEPLAHLLLIVDEFTELKRFSNDSNDIDFIKDITTIARVGRTLGFHIILVSQNIEGAITEDIRVNSKARICLKVATKSASKDMIGTPDAAAATMPGHGRAYILVGTGSRYEYFQSAYTAANRNMSIKAPVELTYVPDSGLYEPYYNSNKDNLRAKREKQASGNADNADDTQLNYIINAIEVLAGDYNPSIQLFLDPLKADEKSVLDDTDWE